jgi:hypothetical protein
MAKDLLVTTSEKDGIIIHFDKYMSKGYTGGTNFNNFPLNKKKTYRNMSDRIAEAISYVGGRSETFVYNYLKMKFAIIGILNMDAFAEYREDTDSDEEVEITLEQFYQAIDRLIDDEVVKIISDNIEEIYYEPPSLSDDKIKNVELQFKPEHTKAVIKASFAAKLIIPIIMDFCELRFSLVKAADPISENPTNSFIFSSFLRVLRKFTPSHMNLENKLFKLAESRVVATNYSDKIIWSYLKNLGITPDVFIRILYRKTICDTLPKLAHNRGIVSYIHTTLKNQLMYLFTQNFPIQYRPINTIDIDSDEGSNPFERIEQAYQHDEGLKVINDANIESIIRKYIRELDYDICPEELSYYLNRIKINDLQKRILTLIYQREMGRQEALNSATKIQYIKLLMIAEKLLYKHDLPILADYLTGIPKDSEIIARETLSSKKFISELIRSTSYKKIHSKFSFIGQRLADSTIVIKFIATLEKNKFDRLPRVDDEDEYLPMSYNISSISDEVLRFIHMVS